MALSLYVNRILGEREREGEGEGGREGGLYFWERKLKSRHWKIMLYGHKRKTRKAESHAHFTIELKS